jgi:hypothetical protein
MAYAPQLPGTLHVAFVRGDDYSTLLDLSISLVGYSLDAQLYSLTNGQTVATPTVSVVDAAAGKFNLTLSDAQAAALPCAPEARLEAPAEPGRPAYPAARPAGHGRPS